MQLILQTILVFGFIIFTMTYYGKVAYRHQYPQGLTGIDMFAYKKMSFWNFISKFYFFIPIFIFCLFSALRYGVGMDCESYKNSFYNILQWGTAVNDEKEYGFIILSKMTMLFTDTHYLFFFILAFLQIGTIYFALRKKSYAITYLGLVIMLGGTYYSLMNGVRQEIAACILVAIIPFVLEKKKWILFVMATFVASLMHKSAFCLLPIGFLSYFILKKDILDIYTQIAILAVCYIFMDKFEISFLDSIFSYGAHAGYDDRAIENYTVYEIGYKNFGFSSWLLLSTKIFAVFYSKRMQNLANDKVFNIMYNLFFIGTCISLLFYNNYTIGRLNYYFIIFTPIILSIMLFVMSYSNRIIDKQLFYITLFILIINTLYNCYKAVIAPFEITLYKFDFSYF